MPSINFQPRFASLISAGKKRQTIRRQRKNPIKEGDTLYLFTGLRTNKCHKIKTVTCIGVDTVVINDAALDISRDVGSKEKFARADGFKNYAEMKEWFREKYGLPFIGTVIRW